jgi:spore coat protein A, manganese oxidase
MFSYKLSRRRFLLYGGAAGAALFMPLGRLSTATAAMGGKLAKYLEPVPVPGHGIVVARPSGTNAAGVTTYAFNQVQISRQLHPQLPPTPFWAYDDGSGLAGQAGSFGMAVVARSGTPLEVSYTNSLPQTYPVWIPVDTRLTPNGSDVRVMTHLHGGFVAADSDGNPAITPHGFGHSDVQTVSYPNESPENRATLLWFHDHGLGATRLNVFAGLAGAYLIRDEFDTGGTDNANGLPSGEFEIPLVIQDRQFNPDGTFLYPTSTIPGATWIGEYFGDVMLVNGKVWPFLDVRPQLYRFRILNGCNARILNLDFSGAQMWQIGAEGGLFDQPVPVKQLVMAPAERADVLVDFSRVAPGSTTVVKNSKPQGAVSTPAPSLTAVMQIRVAANATPVPPTIPATLLGGMQANLPNPVARRFITLNEVAPETADWHLTMNGVHFEDGPATETPKVGTVEDWYYVNLTVDTHPMHTHLFMFQVVGRVPFDVAAYTAAAGIGPDGVPGGLDPTPFATGPLVPADPSERGFKDTVKANPGYFTIVRARFDLPAGVTAPQTYVHHCHIVEHEDNDMMRPHQIIP